MQWFALDSSRKKPSLTFQHRAIATGTQKDSSLMSFSPKDQTMWVFPAPYPELQPFGIKQRFQLTEHTFLLKVVSMFIPNPHLHLKVSNTRMGRDRNEGTFVTKHGIMRCTVQSCHTHHCSPALSDERGLWLAGPALFPSSSSWSWGGQHLLCHPSVLTVLGAPGRETEATTGKPRGTTTSCQIIKLAGFQRPLARILK